MNLPKDSFTFRACLQTVTSNGAYLLRDTLTRREAFVPIKQCITRPGDPVAGQEVEVTLSRPLARQKGFLVAGEKAQGRLL